MEASIAIRDHVLNPTSVYSQVEFWDHVLGNDENLSTSWDTSSLNPKNRIDSTRFCGAVVANITNPEAPVLSSR